MNMMPDVDDGFADRINVSIERAGGVTALARKSGLSEGVILKYRKGESDPSRRRLVAIAEAADVSLAWLATGEGSMRRGEAPAAVQIQGHGWDAELMRDSIKLVEELLIELDREMEPEAKADLIFEVYGEEMDRKAQGRRLSATEVVRIMKRAV